MPEVKLILNGMTVNSDQGRFGMCTVALIKCRPAPHG